MQQPEEPRVNEHGSEQHRGDHRSDHRSDQESLVELMERHRALEQSLQLLASRRTLTPAEQREVAQLKKQKLLTKDRIARMSGGGSVEQ